MPVYAILGATGSAGTSIVRHILKRPPVTNSQLNLYVRSTKKLLSQNPGLAQRPDVAIFEAATLDHTPVLSQAISNADYIFSCTGNNESPPRLSVALDTANTIDTSLRKLPSTRKIPTIVVLSSSCLNPLFSAAKPRPLLWLIHTALSNSCNDLRRAEVVYRALQRDRHANVIFAQPGSLMASRDPTGHELSTTESTMMLGYADLGPGMVEMAERGDEFAGKGVSVNATGAVVPDPGALVQYLISGLVAHFLPGVWPAARRLWGTALAVGAKADEKRIEA